ncbi:MAG TPA: aldehyde dehydrogenase family protein [Solirubrobacteraceae bacterium]|jgi:RHH-type proline utilization regulon transcriptional repressor/proline dehydrogenase/delta 1-pyrroline-5-carboxylate dehydrogenase|nr:aldehyde dehydrogenase family protein [Solirubrobacteraceae bacterium]
MSQPFVNEPHLELRRADVRDALLAAGEELRARLPLTVPVLAAAGAREGRELVSVDPGSPQQAVACAPAASRADVDAAVAGARAGHREWAGRTPAERAQVLLGAAALMRERRLALAALAVYECAKPWREADADVCEAIDFLEYYARRALELDRDGALGQPPGERNTMRYLARGTVAVIAPWNFPFAIPTGMTAGALAPGNAVILKPAEQSPACAHAVVSALREAGVPPPALSLLPGADAPGAALVSHPGVDAIAFTGSSRVGLEIVRAAAEAPGQAHVKRVVAEMGGKNCVIVDSDADLDQAVPAVVRSAFTYAGQKCSAAARVLAHERVYERLLERLSGAVGTLRVGQARELGIDVPPVIDDEAQRRISSYIERGAREGTVCEQVAPPAESDGGYFVPPTLLAALRDSSPLLAEEIFGPVLTVEAVPDVAAACDVVDSLPFALTGGLFSRNPAIVKYVIDRSPVGNLYVNREITGAMVGRQPFGGNRLSGTGAKAGGPDYLLEFAEARVVCEDTTRHGLVV